MQGLILTINELLQRSTADLVENLQSQFPQAEPAQVRSWKVLINELKGSSCLLNLPQDCVLALEYALPTDDMAIDLLVTGLNPDGKQVACMVESKQWGDTYIRNSKFAAYREPGTELHPQIQVGRHRRSFCDYLDIGPSFIAHPFVYTPNASDHAVQDLIDRNPWKAYQKIPVINSMDRLLEHIGQLIAQGCPAIAQQLMDAQFTPSLEVVDAMGAIVTGEEAFLLTREQEEAAQKIRASIAAGKRIIRVTGAAGAGKTGLLLNLYLQYLSEATSGDILPILVCGAQNTAFYQSTYPQISSAFSYSLSVSSMIRRAGKKRCFVFMDEAQHNQPGIITQIMNLGATLVLCYDVTQVINAENAIAELRQLEQRPDFLAIKLQGSIRFNASQVAEKNIRDFLRGNTQFQPDPLFEFQAFSDFSAFQEKLFDTIARHPDRSLAVTGLLCADAADYTSERNPNSRLFTNWKSKSECQWMPYVRNRNYLSQYGGKLWVGTWWMPGLDCDYIAVIAGGDVAITPNGVVAIPQQMKHYRMVVSLAQKLGLPQDLIVQDSTPHGVAVNQYKSCQRINAYLAQPGNESLQAHFIQQLSPYLRNNYYIMMSRGRRGCFVYFANHYHNFNA